MFELVLAVDIGGTKLAVGRVDGGGVLLDQRAVPTPAARTAGELWDVLAGLVSSVRRATRWWSASAAVGRWSPGVRRCRH